VLWEGRRSLRTKGFWIGVAAIAAGGLLPLVLTLLYLLCAGVFPRFWFWVFSYARAYVSLLTPRAGWRVLSEEFRRMLTPDEGLWMLAGAGLVYAVLNLLPGRKQGSEEPAGESWPRENAIWVLLFLFVSLLAVCPGFYFRGYYFILLEPALGLLAGAGFVWAGVHMARSHRAVLAGLVLGFAAAPLFVAIDNSALLGIYYERNPFVTVADYIRNHSDKNASIAVLGSNPEVYFYAQRHSATDYVLTYALSEEQPYALRMQEEMISDIERVRPEYIVAVNMYESWGFVPGFCGSDGKFDSEKPCDYFRPNDREDASNTAYGWDYLTGGWIYRRDFPTRIFDWFAAWGPQNYDVVGFIGIRTKIDTDIVWGERAATMTPPPTGLFLRVYKRKS
jgi:hypothetical protein